MLKIFKKKKKKKNDDLLKEIENLKLSSKVYSMCETLQTKIDDLSKILENFTNGKKALGKFIGN